MHHQEGIVNSELGAPQTAPHLGRKWTPGTAPVAVVMISLNEAHSIGGALESLAGWALEVFLVDSYSRDDTVGIALENGVHVVQRRFRSFGDQWNFALETLPIRSPWTMKLDPDERLSPELKANLQRAMQEGSADGFSVLRRLWIMGRPLPVRQRIVRAWRTGQCRVSDVMVNEHPIVSGHLADVAGELEHHDSPDLEHWLEKQNRYTTAEAIAAYRGLTMAAEPRVLGSALQRRMWLKKNFRRLPFRHAFLFLYHWLWQGAWRAGWPGYVWARLRVDVMRFIEYKRRELEITGRVPGQRVYGPGKPDPRVPQFD